MKVLAASVRARVADVVGKVITVASVPEKVSELFAVKVFPSAMVRVAEVAGAVMVNLLTEVAVATPKVGVTKVGEVFITKVLPVPVCEATEVALPTEVMGPVKLASVVTVAALPVMLPTIGLVTVRSVSVPKLVSEEAVTPEAKVVPVSVPAAAVTVMFPVPSKETPLIVLAV